MRFEYDPSDHDAPGAKAENGRDPGETTVEDRPVPDGGTGALPAVRRLGDWDSKRLRRLAAEHDTPLYVVDLDRVRENYRRLSMAFPEARVQYAAKANTSPAVIDALTTAGAGVEVASPGELRVARSVGVGLDCVHYTTVNPPAGDLDTLVETWRDGGDGLTVTAGAHDTVSRLAERGYDGRLALRVNPGLGAGHHEKVVTGADRQFGLPVGEVPEVAAAARDQDFDLVGVHAHVGSGVMDNGLDRFGAALSRVGEVAQKVGDLEFVDLGGGLGVPYHEDDSALDLEAAVDTLRGAVADVDAEVVVEPGRFLVADAGVLLTRVNTVKGAASPLSTVAGVDAGLHTLLRPALFDAYHPIRNLAPDRPTDEVSVGGPVCSSADTFCEDRPMGRPERGDVLAVGNAGAYGHELSSRFHTRGHPAEVAIDGAKSRVVRPRESLDEALYYLE